MLSMSRYPPTPRPTAPTPTRAQTHHSSCHFLSSSVDIDWYAESPEALDVEFSEELELVPDEYAPNADELGDVPEFELL